MKKWTIRILVLLFLLTGSACSQSVPPAEGEETLLVQGESGGPENLPPAFDPVVPAAEAVDPQWFADAAFVGDSVAVIRLLLRMEIILPITAERLSRWRRIPA